MTLFGTDANHSTKSAQVHRHYGTALVEAAAIEKANDLAKEHPDPVRQKHFDDDIAMWKQKPNRITK